MKIKWLFVTALTVMMVLPVMADEVGAKKKKGKKGQQRGMASQLIKRIDEVKLTEEQVAKIQALGKTADQKAKEIRDTAGLNRKLMKNYNEARKSFSDTEMKGKELAAAIIEKAGLNEDQVKALKEVNRLRTKMNQEAIAMLTDEQKELVPKQMKRAGKRRGANKRKKKDANKKKEAA